MPCMQSNDKGKTKQNSEHLTIAFTVAETIIYTHQLSASHLEKVVLEEVAHGLVGGHRPPGVDVEVERHQPADQQHGGQLRLVADRHQHHQHAADDDLRGRSVRNT